MLTGLNVCLAPILDEDHGLLFQWLNSVALARYSAPFRPVDHSQFQNWLHRAGTDPSRIYFTIRQAVTLRLLGYLELIHFHPVNRSAELGMLIGENMDQNQGFGQEAVRLALHFCWREMNLNRVSLKVRVDNARAIRVYLKCGFEAEGVLRQAAYIDGAFVDMMVMAALRPDPLPDRL